MPSLLLDRQERLWVGAAWRDLNEIEEECGIPRTPVPALYDPNYRPPRPPKGLHLWTPPKKEVVKAEVIERPAPAPEYPPGRSWAPPVAYSPSTHHGLSLPIPGLSYKGPNA